MKKIKLFLYLFLVLLSGMFFTSCSTKNSNIYCRTYKIEPVEKEYFYGYVKFKNVIDLSFLSEGKVIYCPYTKGDFVKKGQVLARLDGILYKIKQKEQQAKLTEAKIRHDRQGKYYKRMDILHKQGAISDNDWEEAYYGLKTSAQNIVVEKELLNYLNQQIGYTVIVAPFDGYINEIYIQKNEYATTTKPAISIMNSPISQVETSVDYNVAKKLFVNKKVMILKNGLKYCGKIAHISRSDLNDGGYIVKIYLDKNYPEFYDGLNVEIDFDIDKTKFRYIPLDFVKKENSKSYVFVLNGENIEKREISVLNIEQNKVKTTTNFLDNEILINSADCKRLEIESGF